jgi:hypothetical protein
MKRVLLFLATNLAIIVVASITLSILGVGSFLDETGTGLNLQNLLIFCLVFGMAGIIHLTLAIQEDCQMVDEGTDYRQASELTAKSGWFER